MYVYFDKNGVLKEIINDDAIRQGNNDVNKIYIYVDTNISFSHAWWTEKKSDGTTTLEKDFITNIVYQEIPYDPHRDLKFFKDYKTYKFYTITLEDTDLDVAGLGLITVRFITQDDEIFAQGLITFNIEDSVIKTDHEITQSQYDYLLTLFSGYLTGATLDGVSIVEDSVVKILSSDIVLNNTQVRSVLEETSTIGISINNGKIEFAVKPSVLNRITANEQNISDLQNNKLNKNLNDLTITTEIGNNDLIIINKNGVSYKILARELKEKDDHYLGNYSSLSSLETAHPTARAGDYAFVEDTTDPDDTKLIMYIWDNADSEWQPTTTSNYVDTETFQAFQQSVNLALQNKQDTLSQAQLNAVNSGITSQKISDIDNSLTNLSNNKQDKLVNIVGNLENETGDYPNINSRYVISADGSNLKKIPVANLVNKYVSYNATISYINDIEYPADEYGRSVYCRYLIQDTSQSISLLLDCPLIFDGRDSEYGYAYFYCPTNAIPPTYQGYTFPKNQLGKLLVYVEDLSTNVGTWSEIDNQVDFSGIDLSLYEQTSNKTSSITADSTATQYASAKGVYDTFKGRALTLTSSSTTTTGQSVSSSFRLTNTPIYATLPTTITTSTYRVVFHFVGQATSGSTYYIGFNNYSSTSTNVRFYRLEITSSNYAKLTTLPMYYDNLTDRPQINGYTLTGNKTGANLGLQNALTTSSVSDGTLDKSIGFDSNGNLVKGSGGGSVEANPVGTPSDNLNSVDISGTIYRVQILTLSNTSYVAEVVLTFEDSSTATYTANYEIVDNDIYLSNLEAI